MKERLLPVMAVLVAFGALCAPAADAAMGIPAGDPMSYPSSAMGIIAGLYQGYPFNCSASVVDTPGEATVVMTAGHCAVNEDTGVRATRLAFLPAYHEGTDPYGSWPVASVAVDPRWRPTADDDRAGDVAFMTLADRGSWSLKEITGSIGISFGQPTAQTYTEWGYPDEDPYTGEELVALTAGLAAQGSEWSPPSLGIDSDFTSGSSGGPWTTGAWNSPTAISITSYRHDLDDGLVWGPYFGPDVQSLFASVGGDPNGAVPVPAVAERPHLKLWVFRRGATTIAHFRVEPGYPLNAWYRCLVKGGRWQRCRNSREVPAGKTLQIKVRYGTPGYWHFLGPRVVMGAPRPRH